MSWRKDDDEWYGSWYCDYCGPYPFLAPCPKCNSKNIEHYSDRKCYITTACCDYMDLPDDCDILSTMRTFRDQYGSVEHPDEVEEYYRLAPMIINNIDKSGNNNEIYSDIYNILKEIVQLVEVNKMEDAYRLYKKMTCDLKDRFMSA